MLNQLFKRTVFLAGLILVISMMFGITVFAVEQYRIEAYSKYLESNNLYLISPLDKYFFSIIQGSGDGPQSTIHVGQGFYNNTTIPIKRLEATNNNAYSFKEWRIGGTTLDNSEVLSTEKNYTFDSPVTTNISLLAVYERTGNVVVFDKNKDNPYDDVFRVDVKSGDKVPKPSNPQWDGYSFEGWYLDDDTFLNKFDFDNTIITEDIELFAKWNENVSIVPATLVGSSIFRKEGLTAIKYYSDKEGTFYFYVSSDSATPTADEIKSATSGLYTGDAIVGTNIFTVEDVTTGPQYIYILVDNGSDSNILTIEIPYNTYYFENFESYPLNEYISNGALYPISQIHNGNGDSNQKVATSITEGKMLSLTSSGSWASDQIIKWDSMVPTTGVYVFEGDISTTYSSTETDSWLGRFTMTNGSYGIPNKEMGVQFYKNDIREATNEVIALKDSFTKNTWYHIKIEAFPENNMYFVYVDGEKFGTFDIPVGIDRMAITAGHGFTTYFDNFVYYADPSLDVPSMKKVIVNNGVSSATDNIATEDDIITITANTPTNGLEFYKWKIISGGIELEDEYSSTTTFTMGTDNVEIKAEYKAVIQGQLIYELSDTYGDGWNGNSIQIIDISGDTLVETLTISSGSTNNGTTANLEPGHIYNLYWNHGSYPGETSFKLKNSSGDVLFEGYGNVNLTESGVFFVVEIRDTEVAKTYTAKISTTDVADGEEIEGATLQILDEEGIVVSEWTSSKESHEVSGLSSDIEYTLRNTVAPEGYTIATDTTFTIDDEGRITSTGTMTESGTMLVEFAKTQVKVLAVKDSDYSSLSNVTLQIVDGDGNVVEEWSSTNENHTVEGLLINIEYTLKVTAVPALYEIPSDSTFVINDDETVTSTCSHTDEGVLLVEISEKAPETYTVTFNPNGGTVSPTTKEVTKDGTYGELPTPTNEKDVEFLGWYKEKVVHDDNTCFDDTTVDGWVIRATPAEDMDYHNSGVHYFEVGDVLVFDITIDGLDEGIEIDKVDVNDQYLPDSDFIISANKQNIKGYTTITDDQYGYVLDFIDVEVTGNVGYTINEFALYKSKVTSADTIENSNHTLIAAWSTNGYVSKYTVTYDANGGTGTMSGETSKYYIFPSCDFTAPTGKTFDKWEVNGKKYKVGDTLTLTEDITVKATWKNKSTSSGSSSGGGGGSSSSSYKITTKIESGIITPANASVKKNADQEFAFKVNDGYEIKDVLVDGKSVGAVNSYKLEKVTAKHTIEVKTAKVSAIQKVDDWAKEEMTKAFDLGLIPETFASKDATKAITRLEFAAVAVKLYEVLSGKKAELVAVNPFTDTNDEYLLKAYALGITVGTSETTFTPNAEITREQMATMLTRALSKAGINTEYDITNITRFADDNELSDWARSSVYFMAKNEIIKGIGDNRFQAKGNAKVEEAIAIVLRSVEIFGK